MLVWHCDFSAFSCISGAVLRFMLRASQVEIAR